MSACALQLAVAALCVLVTMSSARADEAAPDSDEAIDIAVRVIPPFGAEHRGLIVLWGGVNVGVGLGAFHAEAGVEQALASFQDGAQDFRWHLRAGWRKVFGPARDAGGFRVVLPVLGGLSYYDGASPYVGEYEYYDLVQLDFLVATGAELAYQFRGGKAVGLRLLASMAYPVYLDDSGYSQDDSVPSMVAPEIDGLGLGWEIALYFGW